MPGWNGMGARVMLGCWWHAEVLVECQGAGGMLGMLVECYRCWWNARGAGEMPGCWWNAEVLVEYQGACGMLGVVVEC